MGVGEVALGLRVLGGGGGGGGGRSVWFDLLFTGFVIDGTVRVEALESLALPNQHVTP